MAACHKGMLEKEERIRSRSTWDKDKGSEYKEGGGHRGAAHAGRVFVRGV